MFRSFLKVTPVVVLLVLSLTFAAGCGGGGFSVSVTPNPGGSSPSATPSPVPAITLGIYLSNNGVFADAAPGTFGPGAEVIVRDAHGYEVHATAAGDGSFYHSGFPAAFDASLGSMVEFSQVISGMSESAPRSVSVIVILGP